MKYPYCISLTGHKTLKPNNLLGKEICTSNSNLFLIPLKKLLNLKLSL